MKLIFFLLFFLNFLLMDEEYWYLQKKEGKKLTEILDDYSKYFYEELKKNPGSFLIRANLLKVLYFKGTYTNLEKEKAKEVFSLGKTLGKEGKEILMKNLKLENLKDPKEIYEKGKDIEGLGEFFFWDSACWGQWALLYGKLKAAKEGAAKKILISAETALNFNEKMEDGGPHRVLGRLHHQTPKIPLITGWVSKDKALAHLKKALEFGPEEPMNYLFLGELYLDLGQRDKAKEIFEAGLKLPIREKKEPADLDSIKKIKENLEKLKK